jgi:hypothetical protein
MIGSNLTHRGMVGGLAVRVSAARGSFIRHVHRRRVCSIRAKDFRFGSGLLLRDLGSGFRPPQKEGTIVLSRSHLAASENVRIY